MDTIFFDLDGTLTDPKPGITRSIRYALQKLDHPVIPTEDELTWCIGPPLRSSFVKMLGEDSADRAVTLYRERFSEIGLYENRVYDGIGEVLTTLRHSGHRLFVATSKAHVYADRIIDHFGLRPHFRKFSRRSKNIFISRIWSPFPHRDSNRFASHSTEMSWCCQTQWIRKSGRMRSRKRDARTRSEFFSAAPWITNATCRLSNRPCFN